LSYLLFPVITFLLFTYRFKYPCARAWGIGRGKINWQRERREREREREKNGGDTE